MSNIYLCVICDAGGTLRRVKPSTWYVCTACFKRHHGDTKEILTAVMDRLKQLCLDQDPRMNNPRVLEQVETLGKELRDAVHHAQAMAEAHNRALLERTTIQ
jgi:hypothetical protein